MRSTSGRDRSSAATPLHYAANNGHAEVAAALLAQGSRVDARMNGDVTGLHLAAHGGHTHVAALLLENGLTAQVKDGSSTTPLHSAANNGHAEVSLLLLYHGADAGARDNAGRSPRDLAMASGRGEWMAATIEADAEGRVRMPADASGDDACHLRRRLAAFQALDAADSSAGARAVVATLDEMRWRMDDQLLRTLERIGRCSLAPVLAEHGVVDLSTLRLLDAHGLLESVGLKAGDAVRLLSEAQRVPEGDATTHKDEV